jgi:hypothetical protein
VKEIEFDIGEEDTQEEKDPAPKTPLRTQFQCKRGTAGVQKRKLATKAYSQTYQTQHHRQHIATSLF